MTAALAALTGLSVLYGLYYGLMAVLGLFRGRPVREEAPPKYRIAAVIAARNEENVIVQAVRSLLAQRYPRELSGIYVAVNNSTGAAVNVSASATPAAPVQQVAAPTAQPAAEPAQPVASGQQAVSPLTGWQQQAMVSLLECADMTALRAKLNRLKAEYKIKRYGTADNCPSATDAYWAVFDGGGKLVTILGPGTGQRVDYKNMQYSSLERYKGMNALWFNFAK